MIEILIGGLDDALTPVALLYVAAGVLWGIVAGGLPGLTSSAALALALPITFGMTTTHALLLMMAIVSGSMYGNSIPSVLLRTPGTPSAILTAIEGFEMHRRGEGVRALKLCLYSSVIGQFIGLLFLVLTILPLARAAIGFLAPEQFALAILGMVAAAGLAGKHPVKGLMAAMLGVGLSLIGTDPVGALPRYTFGQLDLRVGLDLVAVLIGMLTISQAMHMATDTTGIEAARRSRQRLRQRLAGRDVLAHLRPSALGGVVGALVGAIPGVGSNIGTFIAYENTRMFSRDKSQFGNGSSEALVSVDSAANAGNAGEMIPTLGIGIPGSAIMAVVLASVQMHGLQPGPLLTSTNPEVLGATFAGLLLGGLLLLLLGRLLIAPSVFIATVRPSTVTAAVMALTIVGVYSINRRFFDVWVALVVGLVAYLLTRNGFPLAPMALGFVLGRLAEEKLRMGLVMVDHDVFAFITRPWTGTVLLLALLLFTWQWWGPLYRKFRGGKPARTQVTGGHVDE